MTAAGYGVREELIYDQKIHEPEGQDSGARKS